MDKTAITRTHLKKNFLKRIELKIDFKGIHDSELDKIIPDISKISYANGYSERRDRVVFDFPTREDDFELDSYEVGSKVRSVVFENPMTNSTIELSPRFFKLSYEERKHNDAVELLRAMRELVKLISNPQNTPFFRFTRMGISKFNRCIFIGENDLNRYLEGNLEESVIKGHNISKRSFSKIDRIVVDESFCVNVTRRITYGKSDGVPACEVRLINSIFTDNLELCNRATNDDGEDVIERMNDMLFSVYKEELTDYFLNILVNGEETPNIKGVKSING